MTVSDNWEIDLELEKIFRAISINILIDVPDPKGIQGNINSLTWENRKKFLIVLPNYHKKLQKLGHVKNRNIARCD